MSEAHARWTRPATLMSTLGFDADDLAANRAGRLGAQQLARARTYAITWVLLGVLFLVAMGVAEGAELHRDAHGVTAIATPLVLAALGGGSCFLLAAGRLRARSPTAVVTRFTGAVRQGERSQDWFVGEKAFRGPGPSGPTFGRSTLPDLLEGKPICHVYVLRDGTAVSIERVTTA